MSTIVNFEGAATERPGPKRKLSKDEFARLALDLVNRDGMGALNVRRLAAELKVSPGSLYTYFRDKDALLDRMLGYALGRLPEVSDGGAPRDDLIAAFASLQSAMQANPSTVELLMAGVASPQLDRFREHCHEILHRAGADPATRVRAINLLMSLVIGSVVVDAFRGGVLRPPELARRRRLAREFALLREASRAEHQPARGSTFAAGLVTLVDDLLEPLGAERRSSR